jgi:4-oxalocrotonate tautomerase
MPIINVQVSAEASPQLATAISDAVVELTARVLHKRPELTAVSVRFVHPDHWTIGRKSLADLGKNSFFLEIKVVDGTNTKDEKAQYLRECFATFDRLLGNLHAESYVHIHDVRADAYGYGGLTQEHRYVAAKLG